LGIVGEMLGDVDNIGKMLRDVEIFYYIFLGDGGTLRRG
jgi:hypothetical protein